MVAHYIMWALGRNVAFFAHQVFAAFRVYLSPRKPLLPIVFPFNQLIAPVDYTGLQSVNFGPKTYYPYKFFTSS